MEWMEWMFMMDDNIMAGLETHTFELLKIRSQVQIDDEVMRRAIVQNSIVNASLNRLCQTHIVGITTLFAAKKDTYDNKYPKTWWDGFKLEYFPDWLLKKYPAQMTCVHIDMNHIFPDIPALEQYQRGVRHMRIDVMTNPFPYIEEDSEDKS